MRSILSIFMLLPMLVYGWTFKTVSHPFDSTRHAYLKRNRDKNWFLFLPGDMGFQTYVVTNVTFKEGMVTFDYTFGHAALYEVPTSQQREETFFFVEPDPFDMGWK